MEFKNLFNSVVLLAILCQIIAARPFDEYDKDEDDWDISLKNPSLATCDPCPGGWGVKTLCNRTHNTICTPCPAGTWSPRRPHFRPCSPCSKCGDGLYEDMPCTNVRDTKCDSCSNGKGHLNEDYKRKCDWKHAPDTLKMIEDGDQELSTETDGETQFYEKSSGKILTMKDLGDRLVKLGFGEEYVDGKKMNEEMDDESAEDDKKTQSLDDPKNPSFWQDRLTEMRRRAEQLSKSLITERVDEDSMNLDENKVKNEANSDEDDDDDDDDEDLEDIPKKSMSSRPYVQQVMPKNAPKVDQWVEDAIKEAKNFHPEINYPPSYHQYSVDSLMHQERRKAKILIVLTVLLVASGFVFVIYVFLRYSSKRRASTKPYGRIHVVNLSPEEQEIVRRSATQLSHVEDKDKNKLVKKFQLSHKNGYTTLVDSAEDISRGSNSSLAICENPLEAYLLGEDLPKTHQKV